MQLWLLVAFVASFSLAMANRRTPALHARYMVCVALTLNDPIMARLIYTYSGVEPPHMQVATYLLIDGILLALIAGDMRLRQRSRVYPGMLAFFLAAQLPTFFVHALPAWRSFAHWIAALPLP